MKRLFLVILLVLSLSTSAQTVKVAAAANLRYVLEDIKAQYEKQNPKAQIVIISGSSGTLYQQILNGAGFHLFMAADKDFPLRLKSQGAVSGQVRTYAFGKLALWSSSVDVGREGLNSLLDNSVRHIAIAKPELAPYGESALQALKYYGIYEKIKDKLVFADNISQAAQYVQTGNAEAGLIALSLVNGPGMKGFCFLPDTKSYKPVEQAMVLLKGWERNPAAVKFMNYVLSASCRPIFEKYGYMLP